MSQPAGFLAVVTCKQCGAHAETGEPGNFGQALACPCCTVDHDHDEAANTCDGTHAGDCAAGNPDCPVCRPVHVEVIRLGPVIPVG